MRFGKHPAKCDYRTLRLSDYLNDELPAPPAAYSAMDRAFKNLPGESVQSLFPMYANDKFGDCTIAGLVHAASLWHALVGKRYVTTDRSVVKFYMSMTGGVDSGLVELDVLNYWRKHVISQDQILAFVKVNPRNHTHVKQAIQLFGCVYLGFQCQEATVDDFQAGRPWTPGPLTQNGHAVDAVAYDNDGVTCLTWGDAQKGTWAWWDETVDECYCVLSSNAKKENFSPGLSFDQLQADLMAVAR